MTKSKLFVLVPIIGILSGCAASGINMPLVFGQSHTVGISISGSTADQGADLTIGYKDKDIAIVPVTISQKDGANTQVKSSAGAGHEDALSVLGQFELSADAKQVEAGLGKFFATGIAAKTLADGFKAKLSK